MAAPRAICTEVHEPQVRLGGSRRSSHSEFTRSLAHSRTRALARPSQAVTHSASCVLTGEPNLVLCRQRYIDLYRIVHDKLELVCTRRLHGTVESLAVLNNAIVLTFRDAKVSVVRWNAQTWDLECSSMHYFEGDVSLKAGRVCFPSPPFCTVRTRNWVKD